MFSLLGKGWERTKVVVVVGQGRSPETEVLRAGALNPSSADF